MIKKSLRNALVGSAVAAGMLLPAATTVAPSLQLVACDYPSSIATSTDLSGPRNVDEGDNVTYEVTVTAGGVDPKGKVLLLVKGPGRTPVREKSKEIDSSGTVTFTVGNFKVGKKKDSKTFEVTARFVGKCKFRNSSDSQSLTVHQD